MGVMSQARRDGLRAVLSGGLAVLIVAMAMAAQAQAQARAKKSAHASIVRGSSTPGEEWPWAAFVLAVDRREEGFVCTGTVVAPTLILTAGHCIKDVLTGRSTPVHRYVVVTGSGDVRDRGTRQVSKVVRA